MATNLVQERPQHNEVGSDFIPYAMPTLFGEESKLAADALRSTWLSGGAYVNRFEQEIARINTVSHAVSVSNGTVALHLALLALGVGPGDEVIVPAFTFAAAANMTLAVGAQVVTADVDPSTWCLDPHSVEQVITDRTRAIIAVHLYGNVSEMDTLLSLAQRANVTLIEDAAEASFSTYKGRVSGSMGKIGTLSFHAAKTITTGEGGMVLTSDDALHERMLMLRNQGMRKGKYYWHELAGHNFRLTNIQAAIGCAQLSKLDAIRAGRKRVWSSYKRLLDDTDGFVQQLFPSSVSGLLWAFAGKITDEEADIERLEARRDMVMALMKEQGVETRPGFYTLASLPPYNCQEQPNARRLAASVISFPTYPALTDEKITRVTDTFKWALTKAGH